MKGRKWIALALAAIMVAVMLPTLAFAESPVKLRAVYIKHPLTREFSEMEWLRQAEEIANVDIEWQEISADWDQIKATMFASGDIPDLLFTATNDGDYATYVGLFENFDPLISETNTPNIWAFFQAHPEAESMARMLDGSIYGLPKYQRYWPEVATSFYINKAWLDTLGLAVPTTWGEFKTVLMAFRDGDPNGNGDTGDEFPFDFLGSGFSQYHPVMLLGSTGIQLTQFFQDGFFAEDGVVKNAFADERYKELVLFLKDLYAEGLINPETWTNDYSTYQSVARGSGKVAKVGATWGWEITDRAGLELADQYVPFGPLKVSADDPREPRVEYDSVGLNYDKNRVAMSALSKNKEAALRFIDTLYDPEFGLQILWGGMNDIDQAIRKEADGSYTILPPNREGMDWGTWKWTMTWADGGPIYVSDDMVVELGQDMKDVLGQRAIYQPYVDVIDMKNDVYIHNFMKFTSDEMAEISILQADINSVTGPNFVAWVTGAQDIEAEWEGYLDMLLNTMGMARALEIRQGAYDVWRAGLD